MEREKLKELFFYNVVNNKKHAYYDLNVEISRCWKSIVTGTDQDDLLLKYRTKDSEAQKEQRLRVTKSKTKAVAHIIRTTLKEVDRCDNIKDILDIPKNKEQLDEKISNFYGGNSVDDYLDRVYMDVNVIDPNAFLLISYDEYDNVNERASSYPIILRSESIRDYSYKRSVLQYLMFDTKENVIVNVSGKREQKESTTYWCVGTDFIFKLTEIHEGQNVPEGTTFVNLSGYKSHEGGYVDRDDQIKTVAHTNQVVNIRYAYEEINTLSKRVPAMQFGHFLNPDTDQENFESIYWPAKDSFEELAHKKSTYDVHLALHGFAQKFIYVAKCNNVENQQHCIGGVMGGDLGAGTKCKKCNGSGKMPIHRSEGDIITLELPLAGNSLNEEVIDLSKLVYYAEIPKHIIEMHREEVEKISESIPQILFNNYTALKSEVQSATATEITQNKTPVNNVLAEYAAGKAKMYEFIVQQIAIFADLSDGLKVSRMYPSDFGLETISDMLSMLKLSYDSGAPTHITKSFIRSIAAKQNIDNPEALKRMTVKELFRPYSDRNEVERISSLSLLDMSDKKKQLYLRFDDVFKEIDNGPSYKNFYDLSFTEQKVIVDQILSELIPEERIFEPISIDV